MNKVYILTEHIEIYRDELEKQGLSDLEITENRAEANILLAAPPLAAACLNDFTRLDWLQSAYAGVDALMAPGLRRDYQLTNVRGIFGQQISEYVLGYAISHYRHHARYHMQQTQKQWVPHLYQSLAGKMMVILGTGSIATHLAQSARALGLTAIGVNTTGIPARNTPFHHTYHVQELPAALMHADIVVNTLPDTRQTRGLLNQEIFSHCQSVLLFNVGRGPTLNEEDLIPAIDGGHVAHAWLDVFIREPLADSHPFWSHPAITVTPHIAALSFPHQVADIFAHNYRLWCDGFQLDYLVNFERGY